jgi:hypothetical protein
MGTNLESRVDFLFDAVEKAITVLMKNRYLFREFQQILENNADLPDNNHFFLWMYENYIYTASIGVRRLVDRSPKTESLFNLLIAFNSNLYLLSRERYVAEFVKNSGFSEKEANMFFNQFRGEDNKGVDFVELRRDIAVLLNKYRRLKGYVNKIIAHAEQDAFAKLDKLGELPTIRDLDDCIDYIEALLKKYYAIYYQGSFETLVPKFQYPWKDIFKIAWIQN